MVIVNNLVDYTVKHFGDEEKIMAKAGYPDLDQGCSMLAFLQLFVVEQSFKSNVKLTA